MGAEAGLRSAGPGRMYLLQGALSLSIPVYQHMMSCMVTSGFP